MGINPTPFSYKSFTFDGKSTREFGVYITGEGVFNAPERAVEMISIPGRDGEYALDQGHFNNIEVTYRAGIVADSTTDFAEAISNFRNWLASREGYCRLTDEYNTEEYRMAVFKNAIALEHEGLLTGEFDVTFDCKPQRYLAIGEELVEIGAWGNTETAEGEIVTIDASSDTAVKALTVDIVPVQSGSGTPSPDNVRPISGHDDVTVTVADDVDNPTVSEDYTTTLPSTTYGGTLDVVSGVLTVTQVSVNANVKTWTNTTVGGKAGVYAVFSDKLRDTSAVILCNCLDIGTYSTSDRVALFTSNNSLTSVEIQSLISNGDVQIVYTLATPTTTQLTPQQIALLLGENHIFADSGNVTVEYGHNPTILTNPTWFPSKPLLAVEGYGLLKLGKSEIDLDNVPVGDITLLDESRFRLTQTAANTYSVTFTIDEGALNVGDDITASINALPFRFYIVGNGASISPSSYTVADTNSDFVSSLSLGYGGSSADFSGETVINVKFDSGTSSTITNTVSGDLVVNKTYPTPTSNITLTYSVTETVAYDASTHTITLTETATITYSSAYITSAQLRTTSLGASALITAYSTISIIQDEVFIDCDIGEAYTIKDGEPISLNQHIDLGSDLPTLPSGDTEVTYDNTITKVEVKPNWWKV